MKAARYYVLFRCNIKCKERSDCILKLNMPDKYLLDCLRIHVINLSQPGSADGKVKDAELWQGARTLVNPNLPFKLEAGGHSIVCDIIAPYNVEPKKLGVILATSKELEEFTNVELEEQAEYADQYTPYKYGVIFRERIYVPGDAALSLHVRLKKGGQAHPPASKEEKRPAGKKEVPEEKQAGIVAEKELDPPRRIKLELFESGERIFEETGFNHMVISHVKLRKTEEPAGEGKPLHSYILQCQFDISCWAESIKKCEETADISWVLKVISPVSVAVLKDTEKEDKEQGIREGWEDAQPGRADKAKQSRAHFLAICKKNRGEELTPEEQELAKDEGMMKRRAEEKQWGLPNQIAKKAGVKEVKKQPAKGGPPVKEEAEIVEVEKPLPEPSAHVNAEIKEYLEHSKRDRLILIKDTKGKAKKRTPEEVELIKQKQETEIQSFEKYIKEKMDKDELQKKEREEVNFAL